MKFYRIIDRCQDSGFRGLIMRASVEEYVMLKETPCGYWITDTWTKRQIDEGCDWGGHWKKWVSKTSGKRFAYPTMKEAIGNYKCRKRSQLKHAKFAMQKAEALMELIKEENFIDQPGKYLVKTLFGM